MTRANFLRLAGLGAAGLHPLCRACTGAELDQVPSIGAMAEARGLRYGSTVEVDLKPQPADYAHLAARHCKLFAPGWVSWKWVAPTPSHYDFSREAFNLEFAARHGLRLTGAHLLWYLRTPEWFSPLGSRAAAEAAVRRHIAEMTNRFRGRMFSWNVVNEALDPPQGRPDGMRINDPILKALGPDYIEQAFFQAREAAPGTLLVYNDYGFEADSKPSKAKRRALLTLVDRLLARHAPIDAVGLQSHLKLSEGFDEPGYRAFLRELAARNLKVLVTELDVHDQFAAPGVDERDRLVADRYRQFLDVALDESQVVALVTWGLSDRYTWLASGYSPKFARKDGLPCRPLPFDDRFCPKPAYAALMAAILHAPQRALTA